MDFFLSFVATLPMKSHDTMPMKEVTTVRLSNLQNPHPKSRGFQNSQTTHDP